VSVCGCWTEAVYGEHVAVAASLGTWPPDAVVVVVAM
jgi:hypothetical protein